MKTLLLLFAWGLVAVSSASYGSRLYPPEKIPPIPTANLDAQSYINFLAGWQTTCATDECGVWADLIRIRLWMREKPELACEIIKTLFTPSFKSQALVPLLII